METQLPNFTVEKLTQKDVPWFVEIAAVNMLTDELKRPELIDRDNMYNLATMMVEAETAFVVKYKGFNVGGLGAMLLPNLFNPEYMVLSEIFWYVLPDYRNTRAGAMLFKAFDELGSEVADEATMSLLNTSEVGSMEKRGYKFEEKGFRKVF